MRNIDVVKNFLNGIAVSANNLSSSGDRLFSYRTCIAEFDEKGRLWYNGTKYSSTTSKHQHYIRNLGNIFAEVVDIPINSNSIIPKEEKICMTM